MWFEFDQNNSGGSHNVDDKVCHRLFIQAPDYRQAEEKATSMGVYFDGVDAGRDCSCCGDRWYTGRSITLPINYSEEVVFQSIEEYAQYLANEYGWTTPDARIFYQTGEILEINGR